ncbi:MAG: hypothetical protein MI723_11890 [Caulobacterales bacterium]|nr:hypothetical protein [Caulobacterales bacterium]
MNVNDVLGRDPEPNMAFDTWVCALSVGAITAVALMVLSLATQVYG